MAREGVAMSMTKALEQARILAYELMDSWSDLLVGTRGPPCVWRNGMSSSSWRTNIDLTPWMRRC